VRYAIGVLVGRRKTDTLLETRNDVIVEDPCGLLGKLIGSETEWNPELGPIQTAAVEGKLEGGRHDANDRVGLAVEIDGVPEDPGIAMISALPERIADDHDGLVTSVVLSGKHSAQLGSRIEGWEQACA
jgi:hypothetical protein